MPTPSETGALNRSIIEEFRASNNRVTRPRLKDAQLSRDRHRSQDRTAAHEPSRGFRRL